jgi:transposase
MKKKKQTRKKYSEEFKAEALKLADQTTVANAAKQLGIYDSQLYNWRSAHNKKSNTGERENTLAIENAKLKRQLAKQAEELEILKKAATYFAKNQK